MRICIIGAGAIGGYLAVRLVRAGQDVTVIARGANLAAMLSFSLWQRRFGGDVQAIGKTIELDKYSFTIVGVAPPGFRGQNGTADAWTTMMAAPPMP